METGEADGLKLAGQQAKMIDLRAIAPDHPTGSRRCCWMKSANHSVEAGDTAGLKSANHSVEAGEIVTQMLSNRLTGSR